MRFEQTTRTIRDDLCSIFAEVDAWFDREEARRRFEPSDGGWSIDQILEHITLTNRFLMMTLRKWANIARQRVERGDPIPECESDLSRLRVIGERGSFGWVRPEHMEPTGALSSAEVRAALHRQLGECLIVLERVGGGIGAMVRVTMTVNDLGKIDLYQWLYFLAQHAPTSGSASRGRSRNGEVEIRIKYDINEVRAVIASPIIGSQKLGFHDRNRLRAAGRGRIESGFAVLGEIIEETSLGDFKHNGCHFALAPLGSSEKEAPSIEAAILSLVQNLNLVKWAEHPNCDNTIENTAFVLEIATVSEAHERHDVLVQHCRPEADHILSESLDRVSFRLLRFTFESAKVVSPLIFYFDDENRVQVIPDIPDGQDAAIGPHGRRLEVIERFPDWA